MDEADWGHGLRLREQNSHWMTRSREVTDRMRRADRKGHEYRDDRFVGEGSAKRELNKEQRKLSRSVPLLRPVVHPRHPKVGPNLRFFLLLLSRFRAPTDIRKRAELHLIVFLT